MFHLFLCLDSHGPRECGGGADPPVVILIYTVWMCVVGNFIDAYLETEIAELK